MKKGQPIFQLSTLQFDNTLQLLSFAETFGVNSAKLWVQAGGIVQNWVQIGCNFEMCEKEKSRKSLTYKTLSLALQDGLAPWALKLLEIFRICKKLNIN